MPQRSMFAPNFPTPGLKRFRVTQRLRGRDAAAGARMSRHTPSWVGWGTDSYSALQLCRILNLDASKLAAWRKKGFRDFSLGRGSSYGATGIYLDDGWLLAVMACMASLCTDSSLRNLAGAMPASVGNNNVGVRHKQPVTIRVVLLRAISIFWCVYYGTMSVQHIQLHCIQ